MFLNRLCTDEACKARGQCQHMGPRGDYCNFDTEQRLCAMLGRSWVPQLDLDSLLREVESRLEGDASLTAKLAERMKPAPANSLASLRDVVKLDDEDHA